jgi:hypothetical protein
VKSDRPITNLGLIFTVVNPRYGWFEIDYNSYKDSQKCEFKSWMIWVKINHNYKLEDWFEWENRHNSWKELEDVEWVSESITTLGLIFTKMWIQKLDDERNSITTLKKSWRIGLSERIDTTLEKNWKMRVSETITTLERVGRCSKVVHVKSVAR